MNFKSRLSNPTSRALPVFSVTGEQPARLNNFRNVHGGRSKRPVGRHCDNWLRSHDIAACLLHLRLPATLLLPRIRFGPWIQKPPRQQEGTFSGTRRQCQSERVDTHLQPAHGDGAGLGGREGLFIRQGNSIRGWGINRQDGG